MNPLRTYRPRQSFKPRNSFPQGKPRSTRGISHRKKQRHPRSIKQGPAAGQPKTSRRFKSIPHTGKHWKSKPVLIYRRDGKEVCNTAVPEGLAEYLWRIVLMWVRQDGLCCDCGEPLKLREATFEHENGRGAGKRDDRTAIFDEDHFVKHINGAAHLICNSRRGSQRTEIFHGNNCLIEKEKVHAA